MRYLLFLLLLISSVTYSQSNVDFRGDSARFYKNGGSMEVVIRNSTKDRTNGVLVNTGNGVTSFLKYLQIDSITAFRGRFDHQLVLPDDTLSYAPSSIFRTTTRLLAFAPNGNLYKLWNGVWSLVGGGDSSSVQILGDSAIVVNDDTLFVRPIQFETDLAPAYAFQDGDTIRLYPRQYIQDSVLITKSGDTLFFPNGDTVLLVDASTTQRGFVNTTTQSFAGEKTFISDLKVGDPSNIEKGIEFAGTFDFFSSTLRSLSIKPFALGTGAAGLFIGGFNSSSGSTGYGALGYYNDISDPRLIWSSRGVRIKEGRASFTDSANLIIEGDKAVRISVGTTAQRPTALLPGYMRVNTDSSGIEWYNGSAWRVLGSGGGSSTITTGYGLLGDGSGGNPARVDSATLRGDYIRNQFAAKENKSSWFTKARLDSLYSTKVALGAIDPTQINQIFLGIDTGSSPFEGYMYHRMGYRSRVVDKISRASGTHASPTALATGSPVYTQQISVYGTAGYTAPYTIHDVFTRSGSTSSTGPSVYQQWGSGPNTTNVSMQLDSNGVKIGRNIAGFSGTYDSSKNTLDVVGSVGTRTRSVTGTSHTATTNDHTILVSADGGSDFALTIPNPALAPRREYVIKRTDSTLNRAYIKPVTGKIEGLDSMFLDRFSWVTIQSDSVNWHVVSRSSDERLDALEQARNGFSYYQEFISNALFTDGYIFGNASGAGAGVGRGVAVPVALQATNRPGITYVRAGTTTTGRSGFYSDLNFRDNIILGASTVVYENTIAFPDLSDGTDRYQAIFGLHDVAGVNATDGVYFLYDEGGVSTGSAASGNWQIVTASAASRTFNTTTVTVANNTWYRLRIEINKSASEVRFYINGALVGTHTTHIPSGIDRGTIIQASINKSAGTNDRVFAIDYLLLNMRFNSPRY